MHFRPGGTRPRHRVLPAAAAALILGVTSACSETAGNPRAAGDVAGLAVTNFDSGLKHNAPQPDLDVRNVTSSKADTLATSAVADIEDYWSEQMPQHFDQRFRPVGKYISYDPQGKSFDVCDASTGKAGMNAFYCPGDDVIAWDRAELLPSLHRQFGPMGIVTVLAHEYGHAAQFRLGRKAGIDNDTKTIVVEQQADCFAGSYFRWMAEGNSDYFEVSTSQGINQVLASLFFVRDAPGKAAQSRGAHGSAFDRTYALQLGFSKGPERCAEIQLPKVQKRITEQPFHSEDVGEGHSRLTRRTVDYLQTSLEQAFSHADARQPTIAYQDGTCTDGASTPPASYCSGSNEVSIDLAALAELGRPLQRRVSSSGLGDFAAYAEIASRYALGVQKGVGLALDDENAALRTACLVGAWAGATNEEGNKLRLSAGDLDEAIAELLQPNSLIAADVRGRQVPNGFSRIKAFRTGYLQGSSPCTEQYA